MVGAGAVVTKNVPPNAIVVGNPAVIVGYQGLERHAPALATPSADLRVGNRLDLGVGGCALWRLPYFEDLRGALTPLEFTANIPFEPKRSFLVFDVPTNKVRGEHAHRRCHQFLIAAHGELAVVVDDGQSASEVRLDTPALGLHIPPMVWGVQYKFSADAVLLVFASQHYDGDEYVRDYSEFRELAAQCR
jgi:hypothetical protein